MKTIFPNFSENLLSKYEMRVIKLAINAIFPVKLKVVKNVNTFIKQYCVGNRNNGSNRQKLIKEGTIHVVAESFGFFSLRHEKTRIKAGI